MLWFHTLVLVLDDFLLVDLSFWIKSLYESEVNFGFSRNFVFSDCPPLRYPVPLAREGDSSSHIALAFLVPAVGWSSLAASLRGCRAPGSPAPALVLFSLPLFSLPSTPSWTKWLLVSLWQAGLSSSLFLEESDVRIIPELLPTLSWVLRPWIDCLSFHRQQVDSLSGQQWR